MTQHTQGPWSVQDIAAPGRVEKWVWSDKTPVCKVTIGNAEIAQANARLIAAAPDMLAALQELLATCEMNLDDLEEDTINAITTALAAIKKAKGEL